MPPSDQEERRSERASSADEPAGPAPVPPWLEFVINADSVAPSIARDRFDHWLFALGWPTAQRQDLVLALSEAVSNSVEHGYGLLAGSSPFGQGAIAVRADLLTEIDGRRVGLTVRDQGRWREPVVVPESFRGHGLSIMRASADQVTISGDDLGTTMSLLSRLAPPA